MEPCMPRLTCDFESTALLRAAFTPGGDDDSTGTLDITFTSGKTFTFENVPQKVFEELRDAPSPGSYYHSSIKGAY
jgi:hypothetical protein